MRYLDVFFLHMNIVCVTAFGPISLIRFYAPFAVWIAYCLLLNVEWIAIQNYVWLCIYSRSCLMFHTAIKWFWFWFDIVDMISVTHDILRRTDCILYRGPLPFTRGRKMHKKLKHLGLEIIFLWYPILACDRFNVFICPPAWGNQFGIIVLPQIKSIHEVWITLDINHNTHTSSWSHDTETLVIFGVFSQRFPLYMSCWSNVANVLLNAIQIYSTKCIKEIYVTVVS